MGSLVWKLSSLMEYHEEFGEVVTFMELCEVFTLMVCHEVIGGRNVQHLLVCGQ